MPFTSAADPSLMDGSAISKIPQNPMSTANIRRPLGIVRIQIAVTTATTTGSAPFIIPVMLLETVCSASGYNKNGSAIHTKPRTTNRGQCSRATRCRALGRSNSAATPKPVRPNGTTDVWK